MSTVNIAGYAVACVASIYFRWVCLATVRPVTHSTADDKPVSHRPPPDLRADCPVEHFGGDRGDVDDVHDGNHHADDTGDDPRSIGRRYGKRRRGQESRTGQSQR